MLAQVIRIRLVMLLIIAVVSAAIGSAATYFMTYHTLVVKMQDCLELRKEPYVKRHHATMTGTNY